MCKILVVEDERNLRRLYAEELEFEGHRVTAVGNGEEALRALESRPSDPVVLDLALPNGNGMNYSSGIDYLQEMLSRRRDLKVIINSAYPDFKLDFRSWGAERFFTKSSDLSELKKAINELIAKSHKTALAASQPTLADESIGTPRIGERHFHAINLL
jgi:DNA-binding NtrC family response regulator